MGNYVLKKPQNRGLERDDRKQLGQEKGAREKSGRLFLCGFDQDCF